MAGGSFRRRARGATRPLRHAAAAGALRALPLLLRALPRPVALGLGDRLGSLARWLAPKAWRRAHVNIGEIYRVDRRRARRMARRVFRMAGRNAADALARADRPALAAPWIDVQAKELEELCRASRTGGVVLLVPHLGAFELLGTALAARGLDIVVPATPSRNAAFERVLSARRRAAGVRTLARGGAIPALMTHLAEGGIVAILMDQDTKVSSIDADFLGRTARTPVGPAVLALRSGAPVFCASIHLDSEDRHQVRMSRVQAMGERGDPTALSRRFNDALGEHIGRAPEQWVWFHRRWRFDAESEIARSTRPRATPVRVAAVAAAIVAAGAGAGCGSASDEPPAPRVEGPDQIVHDFTLRESERGNLRWSLRSDTARVFRESRTELDGVHLVFLDAEGDTLTTIEAERGRRAAGSDIVVALGAVRVDQADGTIVHTDSLVWNPTSERITTDAEVEIRQGGDLVRGIGLDADPSLEDVVLKAGVSGEFEETDLE